MLARSYWLTSAKGGSEYNHLHALLLVSLRSLCSLGLFIIASLVSTLVPEIQHSQNKCVGWKDLSFFQLQIGSYWVLKRIFMAFGKVWQHSYKVLDTEPGNEQALCEGRMFVLKFWLCLLLKGWIFSIPQFLCLYTRGNTDSYFIVLL